MAENKNVIGSIHVTSTDITCPGCGATNINFDPVTAALSCPFCGLSAQLPTPQSGANAQELDFNSAIQRASVDWGHFKKIMICSNCGGQTFYDSEQITGTCPFCGSSSVAPAADTDQIMYPNAIIPFSVSKEDTQKLFIDFAMRKSLVDKKVFNCKLEKIVGIYIPYWTFDAITASTYCAQKTGKYERGEYVTANWYQTFDDLALFASDRIRHPFISRVQDYDFNKAVPYSTEYLAGIPAERYTLGLNEAWERTKKKMTEKMTRDINRSHRGLLVRDINTNYYNVKFRYILTPVYLAKYKFGDKTYPVAINGQTGKVYCDIPTKIKKIILLSIIGCFIGAAIEVAAIILFAAFFK